MTPPAASPTLSAIGWHWTPETLIPAWADQWETHPVARPARIVEQHRSGYRVCEALDAVFPAESLPEWQRAGSYRKGEISPEARPAVGDWVLVEGEAPNALRIVALLPRFSAIKRGAAGEHYRQQVIAANIDTVFVVCGLDGDFGPRRIERYLLLVAGSGVQPVVVLTKSDKDGADTAAALADLRALEVPVRAECQGPGRGRRAGAVAAGGAQHRAGGQLRCGQVHPHQHAAWHREDEDRRRPRQRRARPPHHHPSRPDRAAVRRLPDRHARHARAEADRRGSRVAESFADIEALAAQCRFRDCRHAQEPGCAVRTAVERGELAGERVANFLKLSGEVAGAAQQLGHPAGEGRGAHAGQATQAAGRDAWPALTPSPTTLRWTHAWRVRRSRSACSAWPAGRPASSRPSWPAGRAATRGCPPTSTRSTISRRRAASWPPSPPRPIPPTRWGST